LGREDFIVAPNNAQAVALMDRWPDWPASVVVITGAAGTGKSHLAHVWRAKSGAALVEPRALTIDAVPALAREQALVLDGMDGPFDEQALFHLLNLLRAQGGFLLITARKPPARWAIGLADLASRLGEALVVELGAPDDSFLTALLIKLFTDRQLDASPELVNYLVSRLERSCAAMAEAVAALDAASLALHRPLSVALAREILHKSDQGERLQGKP
jgi:chromosomal replication initiation ATPase DnaA